MTSRLNWRDSLYKKHLIQRGWCVKTVAENELSWETKRGRVLKSPLKFHKNESTTLYQARVALPDVHHDLRIFSEDGADSNTWGASRSLDGKTSRGKKMEWQPLGGFKKMLREERGSASQIYLAYLLYMVVSKVFCILLSFLLLREKTCPHVNIFQMGRILACENFASQHASGGSGG